MRILVTPCPKNNPQIIGLKTIICSQSIKFKDRSFKISEYIHFIIAIHLAWTIFWNGLVLFSWKFFWWWKCLKTSTCIWKGLQDTCFDVFIKMRFRKIIWSSLVMPNLPRNEYLMWKIAVFNEISQTIFLTPLVRQLLAHTNEECMVISICQQMMLIYQGLIQLLKKLDGKKWQAKARKGEVWQEMARNGRKWQEMARKGKKRRVTARKGEVRQEKAMLRERSVHYLLYTPPPGIFVKWYDMFFCFFFFQIQLS